jgi:hypothetical protein
MEINVVEKASELAHRDLNRMVENELDLYTTEDNGDLRYKDYYRHIFNDLYNEYYSFLTDESF